MQNHRYHILSTRELPADLLLAATEQGMDIEIRSFIQVTPIVSDTLKERIQPLLREHVHVVFTSANAVHAAADYMGGSYPAEWQVYCLDGATRHAVERRLHTDQRFITTDTHAKTLAAQIMAKGNVPAVVFFCGNKRRGELPDLLRQHGIPVEEIVVYDTTEAPVAVEKTYDGIFFFSPSAVSSFFSVNKLPPDTVCFAIGQTTAGALEPLTNNRIIVSTGTSAQQMVQTAIFYFNNN
ncbi:uroporphyrinogen-III synthase [Chitinophaga agrisoli]|uniref:Uroporphyrinogen-III synthase n=1 Tax=Chitinophaga agrisoli TaxID=2607653 RepID=A0A5B2VM99_9BACT|nr:uroporphyrinogen-III synthase [Chitinophaga agrisoli]KAA2240095.1 uroporphyrinogen-III synthase [Chitinophaga agrisoli]